MRAGVRRLRPWLRFTLRWSLRGLALLLLLGLLVGGYLWATTPLPSAAQLRAHAAIGNTRILDRHGTLLYALADPLTGYQQPVALAEIPLALRQATIAIEDRSFYANSGIDLRGITRAAWTNLRSGAVVGGGSTITQQLARNFLLDPSQAQERSLPRKLREATLALKLTNTYSKDEILALYLNQIYYGGTSYGVEAAAQYFFGKPVRELDLAECALLAGLPQAPADYNPFTNLDAAKARQADVLAAMVELGLISADQAVQAQAEPLQFAAAAAPMRAPHFVNYVLDQLVPVLGADTVFRGGLTITTTLDAGLQADAEQSLRQQIDWLSTPHGFGPSHAVHNGAVVVLDAHTGAILTMVGSPNFGDARYQGQVNAAVALRQPGSAIKPLTYAAALERGWTPATSILDIPSSFSAGDGPPYEPQNYDRSFHGPLALREALATSSNVAAVRTLDAIGLPALLEMAERLGISTLGRSPGRYGLALTLGGGEVTLLELTGAFATFASAGTYHRPTALIALSDASGQPIALDPSLAPLQSPQPVVAPEIAYLISDILSDRYARSRAFGLSSVLDVDRPAAVKTGTTTNWRDNWTVGYTPDRVVGVWVGNADGTPMEAISGITGAGPVWHAVMLAAHRGLPPQPFARPPGIVEQTICVEGGMLPGPSCPATRLERFVAGTQPTRIDDTHVLMRVDPLHNCRIPPQAPAALGVERTYRLLPAEAESWALASGLPRPPRVYCESAVAADPAQAAPPPQHSPAALAVVQPSAGSEYALSRAVPAERQQIVVEAQAPANVRALTLFVDGEPLATLSAPPYRTFWRLEPGAHEFTVVAHDAQNQPQTSRPIRIWVASQ